MIARVGRTVVVAKFPPRESPIVLIAGRSVRSLFDDPALLFGTLDDIGCRLTEIRVASLDASSLVVATAIVATEEITPILIMSQFVGSDVTGDKIVDDKQHAFLRRPAELRHELAISYIPELYFHRRFPRGRKATPEERARAFALIGRTDRAARVLRRLVTERPDDSPLLYLLGDVLRDRGEYEEAVEMFRRSAELAPDQIDPRSALAITLFFAHRYREAKRVHAELLVMTNGDFGEYMNLAVVCETLGELDEAWRAVQAALERQPDSTYGHARAAKLAYARGDLAAAQAHGDKARAGLAHEDRSSPMYDILEKLLRESSAS